MKKAQEHAIAASSRDISPSTMRLHTDEKIPAGGNLMHAQAGIMLSTYKDSHVTNSRLKQHEINEIGHKEELFKKSKKLSIDTKH